MCILAREPGLPGPQRLPAQRSSSRDWPPVPPKGGALPTHFGRRAPVPCSTAAPIEIAFCAELQPPDYSGRLRRDSVSADDLVIFGIAWPAIVRGTADLVRLPAAALLVRCGTVGQTRDE